MNCRTNKLNVVEISLQGLEHLEDRLCGLFCTCWVGPSHDTAINNMEGIPRSRSWCICNRSISKKRKNEHLSKTKLTSCTQFLRDVLDPGLAPTLEYIRKPHHLLSFCAKTSESLTLEN